MTRINTVPPIELSDEHLNTELREIGRVPTAVIKRLKDGRPLPIIDYEFRLGSGHVLFFYDKIAWLYTRKLLLEVEARNRGFDPKWAADDGRWRQCKEEFPECWGYWEADHNSQEILRERLASKILGSTREPHYYRKRISREEFVKMHYPNFLPV